MRTDDLDFELPTALIATQPANPRDSARLLVIDRATGTLDHRHIADLPDIFTQHQIHAGDLMVFNRTRVIPARFAATRLATGGQLDGLFLTHATTTPNTWNIMLQSRGKIRTGERIALRDRHNQLVPDLELTLQNNIGPGQWQTLAVGTEANNPYAILDRIGSPPLPPYIRKQRKLRDEPELTPDDPARYNTVFASDPGSVAAPTASLHFTPQLLQQLDTLGIIRVELTLHIGLGTFAPVRAETLEQHDIHTERITIPPATLTALHDARQRNARIIPIGTTAVRALESAPPTPPTPSPLSPGNSNDQFDQPYTADTNIFIHPGPEGQPYPYRYTDALLTNFHLPKSTLLAMVAALPNVGIDNLKSWYRTAIENNYRFYSYGDAMLIL